MKYKISVLMSVYNGALFLREAIDSILAQTFPDFEFVIVNDGSQDSSAEILASYQDPRLKVINQTNTGLAGALNCGLKHCSSDIVVRMDADDIAYPDRIQFLLEDWEKAGRPEVFGSGADYINSDGKLLWGIDMPADHKQIKSAILAASGMMLIHPSVLYSKPAVLSCGGYDETFRSCEDFDLWLRMSDKCRLGNSSRRLLKYRFVSGSMTAMSTNSAVNCEKTGPWMRLLALQKKYLMDNGLAHVWATERQVIYSLLLEKFSKTDAALSSVINRRMTEAKIRYYSGRKISAIYELLAIYSKHPSNVARIFRKRRSVSLPSLILRDGELTGLRSTNSVKACVL